MAFYKTKAVVLSRRNVGEADQVLILYTEKYGKVRVRAKGIRKPLARMTGFLEPLNLVEMRLVSGRIMDIVTGVESLDFFENAKKDLPRISTGYYLAELLDLLLHDREKNIKIWELLLESLQSLAKLPSHSDLACPESSRGVSVSHPELVSVSHPELVSVSHPELVSVSHPELVSGSYRRFRTKFGMTDILRAYFALNLLSDLGYRPELQTCVKCGKKLIKQDHFYFDVSGGGIVCQDCSVDRHPELGSGSANRCRNKFGMTGDRISITIVLFLRFLLQNSLKKALKLKIDSKTLSEGSQVISALVCQHIPRELKTPKFCEIVKF